MASKRRVRPHVIPSGPEAGREPSRAQQPLALLRCGPMAKTALFYAIVAVWKALVKDETLHGTTLHSMTDDFETAPDRVFCSWGEKGGGICCSPEGNPKPIIS